jgi:hypothetical protein
MLVLIRMTVQQKCERGMHPLQSGMRPLQLGQLGNARLFVAHYHYRPARE